MMDNGAVTATVGKKYIMQKLNRSATRIFAPCTDWGWTEEIGAIS